MGGWPSLGLNTAVINGDSCGMPFAEGALTLLLQPGRCPMRLNAG
jgi:hypothetical protein